MRASLSHETEIKVSDLRADQTHTFLIEPDTDARAEIAKSLGIVAVRKLRFDAKLAPLADKDWQLTANLGVTVVQDCVVTLDPVVTRIDEPVSRSYLANAPQHPDAEEAEIPEDETVEPLPEVLELQALMIESIALALPAYPRSAGAELEQGSFTEPGKTALSDEDTKPFAALAALKGKLQPDEDSEPE